MGEEKKVEEGKKEEAQKKETEDKQKPEEKKAADENQKKDAKDEPPPPPPPPEIFLRVHMHCEGCARKVRKCLKGFDGVEDVMTNCKTHKVVVKGEKADPLKVLNRLQKKTNRQVELLSPITKPPEQEPKKQPEDKVAPAPQEQISQVPKEVTVVLKVHMHCEACSLEIKRRIEKMKEVEEAMPDLKNSEVTVKGTFEAAKLVEYVYKRTGKHAVIVKQDPPTEKKEDDKDKKRDNDGVEKAEDGKGDKNEGEGGGGSDGKAATDGSVETAVEEEAKDVEFRRNEFLNYPPRYAIEMHAYPPQIFSDENPNACSVM